MTNCTIVRNATLGPNSESANGGGIYQERGELFVRNTILYDQVAATGSGNVYSDQIKSGEDLSLTVTHSLIDQESIVGVGNLADDPMLDTDFHLRVESPCIDKGDPNTSPEFDYDGDPRPQGALPDIGADEFMRAP